MNILSKILIVVLLSISLQSMSAQDHDNSVSTDGIVNIVVKSDISTFFNSFGTGFFVNPQTLVTAFHVIEKFEGNVSDYLFIIHPETQERIPVHSIQALDSRNDLAVLHIKDYESPIYYELFDGSIESLLHSETYMLDTRETPLEMLLFLILGQHVNYLWFNSREKLFPKFEGELTLLSLSHANQTLTLSLPSDQLLDLNGLSGAPVFSKEGTVIGVHRSSYMATILQETRALSSYIENVRKLFLNPSLECQSSHCIQEELVRNSRFTDGIVTVFSEKNGFSTGFFISPQTFITTWSGVSEFKGKVSDQIFIIHPLKRYRIPAHSIQALDSGNNLAVFNIQEYKSPIYYELTKNTESFEDPLFFSEAYIFDRRKRSFPKIEGELSPYYTFQPLKTNLALYPEFPFLNGLGGSPIFSQEGKVIGVFTKEKTRLHKTAIFSPNMSTIKEVLLKPSLNCLFRFCVQE